MRFTFPYDRAEFIRAQRLAWRHAEGAWQHVARVTGALGIAALVVGLVIPRAGWADFLVRISVWLLMLAAWFWLYVWIIGPLAARQFEKQRPDAPHPNSVTLDETGYQVTSFSATTHLQWPGIRRAVETPEFLLLYLTKHHAYYLPKRAIPSADELHAVRRLLREQLGDRAELMHAAEPR